MIRRNKYKNLPSEAIYIFTLSTMTIDKSIGKSREHLCRSFFKMKKNIQLKTISLILPPIKMMRTFYEKRNIK